MYVAIDAGTLTHFATVPAEVAYTQYVASSNHNYFFRSLAVDHAGNIETKSGFDAQTIVGDFDVPETHVVSAIPNDVGLFDIKLSGRDGGGSGLVFIDVYVSVDGGVAQLIGSAGVGAANTQGDYTASLKYQGKTDGAEHAYRFFSIGRDAASNVETAPDRTKDVSVVTSFADVGLVPTGIDVARGATQRSFIRNLDVLFSNETGLASLLETGRVVVERFALDAATVAPGSGMPVTGFTLDKVGDRLRLDFGTNGITGARTSNAGDGLYRVLIDTNRDGDFADAVDGLFEFHRILGDATGDARVDDADLAVVNGQIGQRGTNLEGDMDGSSAVNGFDVNYVNQQKAIGRQLDEALRQLLDD